MKRKIKMHVSTDGMLHRPSARISREEVNWPRDGYSAISLRKKKRTAAIQEHTTPDARKRLDALW
jgi:hypothetical protein